MTTLVWNYLPEYESEREDILDAVDTVFRSGRLIMGASVRGFEEEYAAYHGVRHCVGVDNGTNAIVLPPCVAASGAGAGDSGSSRCTRARSCPCSYLSSQYDSVSRSSRLASRRAFANAEIATRTATPVSSH